MDLYKLFLALAVGAGALAWWYEQRKLSPVSYLALMCAVVVPGQLFGNLFAAFEHPGFAFAGVFRGNYGANIIGGALGGALVAILLLQIPRLRAAFGAPVQVLDQSALFVPLSMAVGRIGCFAAGDGCYGPPTSLPWGISFPHGTVPTNVPVHPTMLYDALLLLLFFVFINVRYRDRFRTLPKWKPTASFLIFYGVERFLSEFLRLNPKYDGLSQAQWLCIPLFFAGLAILVAQRHHSQEILHST